MENEMYRGDGSFLKFNAYRRVANDLNEAMEIIGSRKLAFGEPACVMYSYPDSSNPEENRMLVGIGGLDGSIFYTTLLSKPIEP